MGLNTNGQLGDGTTTQRKTPVQSASSVAAAACGATHSVFVKTDGTLWAMGSNSNGELGDGTTTQRNAPVQVATGVGSVAAGGSHTMFVKTDGTLWATGLNSSGQLGDGTTIQRNTPVQVATGVASVACGDAHTLFVKTNGTLWAMGYNFFGQLGDGTTSSRNTPVQVATGVTAVSAGAWNTFFLTPTASAAGLSLGAVLPSSGQVAAFGQPVTFQIVASGIPSISYQWRLGGVAIPGATGASYTIPSAASAHIGTYDVVVTNPTGNLSSNVVTLGVSGADISVEQPVGTPIASGGSQAFVTLLGAPTSLTFTLNNPGTASLTGLGVTVDGTNAGDFSVTAAPSASAAAGGNTTFTIQFTPTVSGNKAAALHIANSNPWKSPYNISLSGQILFTQTQYDTNRTAGQSDVTGAPNTFGLYSAAQYAANRTAGQNDVINSPNTYSLYTLSQVQTLNAGTPLLTKDQTTGKFKLTIGIQKTVDLQTPFSAFPFTAPDTTINAQGQMEFIFTVPGSAAFFRVQAQ